MDLVQELEYEHVREIYNHPVSLTMSFTKKHTFFKLMPKSALFEISFDFIRSKKYDKLSQNTKRCYKSRDLDHSFHFWCYFPSNSSWLQS